MNRWMLLLCAMPLILPGCASKEKEKQVKRLCPQTAFVRSLERMNDYGGESPDEKVLVAAAKMKSVEGNCKYSDEGVDVDFTLNFVAEKSPRLGGNQIGFPFFVSIVTPEGKIISKELMTAEFKFGSDKKAELNEDLHVFIPMSKDADGTNYQVLMGFQLTEEQIKAVRKAEDEKAEVKP